MHKARNGAGGDQEEGTKLSDPLPPSQHFSVFTDPELSELHC